VTAVRPGFARRLARAAGAAVLGLAALNAFAGSAELRAKYTELREQLRSNAYQRPIYIDSAEAGDTLKGDIYAVLDRPYETLSRSLENPNDWCAILLLPFNTKYCHPVRDGEGARLVMRIGRKADQPVSEAYRLDFNLRHVAATPDYFEARLTSREGPVGTRDYRITLEAIPLDGHRTFMHLGYSYAYGGMGRFAMQAYLSTAGASKVGFTVVGRDGNGQPVYIGGVRGAVERNVMRYYLAIDAHLASLAAPPQQQLDKRIQAWFDSTEHYARQLHEMDRSQYVALKRGEYERQQTQIE
jgi:hypothetical protein